MRYPYSANVSGARNLRALLDDAMAAVQDATPLRPRPWHPDDLRAVVHAAIDRMKVEGQLFEGDDRERAGSTGHPRSMSNGRVPHGQTQLRRPMAAPLRPRPRKNQPTRTKYPRTELDHSRRGREVRTTINIGDFILVTKKS